MIPIPEELLEQFERGNVLLFVGERISRDVEGVTVIDHLTEELLSRCGDVANKGEMIFSEAAQLYEDEMGRQALVQFLRERLEISRDTPQTAHRLIARLSSCNLLVTTCLDQRLERAFRELGRPLDVIVGNIDIAFEEEHKTKLYKLRGSLERVTSLMLTEDDYETFFENQSSISVVLQGYLARKTILFIGYDLADPHFKRLYRKVTIPLDDYARRAYAFGESPSPKISRWCTRHGIEVVEMDTTAFLEALTEKLASRTHVATPALSQDDLEQSSPLPEQPYKLLDYYETEDAKLFFGRREEIGHLSALIHAHRLVVLYGASGVGKTSLLLAGVLPRLMRAELPYETLYVRALEDPAMVIRRAVRRKFPEVDLPEIGTLVDFLAATTQALGRALLIIFDQFEEFFIRLSAEFRAAFITELGEVHDARDVPVKIVLSLREDWLAAVSEIEERIPEVFRTRLRLLPLTRAQATEAITAPVARLGVRYEPLLVERLLDDLSREGVMPPQLQLVCSALYARRGTTNLITLEMYRELGQARGVLQAYLAEELQALGRDQVLAHGLLEELITSQGTKAVRTADDLARSLQVAVESLHPLLERLVMRRLLRPVESAQQERAFELAHEYLIREIGLSPEVQARKQAEEIIAQELDNYRRFGTLLAPDKLALVDDVRAVMHPGPEAQELLLRSVLQHEGDIAYWLKRVENGAQRHAVLAEVAQSSSARLRHQAAEALGLLDEPASVSPLIRLAVEDSDAAVRSGARASLSALKSQQVEVVNLLVTAVNSPERALATHALEALGMYPLHGLPLPLQARVWCTRARMGVEAAGRWVWLHPVRRYVALTALSLLGLAIVIYAALFSRYYVTYDNTSGTESPLIVVRRGHPGLELPGLNYVVIETELEKGYINKDDLKPIDDKEVDGFWLQRGQSGAPKWQQDVTGLFAPNPLAQTTWYLGDREGSLTLIHDWLDTDVRFYAADALNDVLLVYPEMGTTAMFSATLPVLDDPNYGVQISGISALKRMALTHPALVSPTIEVVLETIVKSNYDYVYDNAMNALVELLDAYPEEMPGVIMTLADHVQSEERNVRSRVAWALGQLAVAYPDAVTATLIETLLELLDDTDWRVRLEGVETITQMWREGIDVVTPDTVMALTRLMADPESNVQYSTVTALVYALYRNSEATASAPVAEALLAFIKDRPADSDQSSDGATLLIQLLLQVIAANPDGTLPRVGADLIEMLLDNDRVIFAAGVTTLRQIALVYPETAKQVVAALLERVDDENQRARLDALAGLSQLGTDEPAWMTPEVVGALLRLLPHEDPDTRNAALSLLDLILENRPELATAETATALLRLTESYEGDVRADGVRILGKVMTIAPSLATEAGLNRLIASLHDPRADVRTYAANSLVAIVTTEPEVATEPQVAALLELLGDDSSYREDYVAAVLIHILWERPALVSPQVREVLLGLMTIQDPDIQGLAIQVLAQALVGDPTPVTTRLVTALGAPEPDVRLVAIEVVIDIAEHGPALLDVEVVEALIALLVPEERYDEQVGVRNALNAVVSERPDLATPEIQASLFTLVESGQGEVFATAVGVLGGIGAHDVDLASQIVPMLSQRLIGSDATSDAVVLMALRTILSEQSQLATSETQNILFALIESEQGETLALALNTLSAVGVHDVDAALPIVQGLSQRLVDPDAISHEGVLAALSAILAEQPQAVSAFVLEAMLTYADEIDRASHGEVMSILCDFLEKNPELATDKLVSALLDELRESSNFSMPALLKIAAVDPEAMSRLVTTIQTALTDRNYDVRMRAAALVQQTVLDLPVVATSEIVQGLELLLKEHDPAIRETAIRALGTVFEVRPDLMTPEIFSALLDLFVDADADWRSAIFAVLLQMATPNRELLLQLSDTLLERLPDSEWNIYIIPIEWGEVGLLNRLLTAAPDLAPEVIQHLADWLGDEDSQVRRRVISALESLVEKYPNALTQELVDKLATRFSEDDSAIRSEVVRVLRQMGNISTPDITLAIARALIGRFEDSAGDVRGIAAAALGALVAHDPALAPTVADAIFPVLEDENWERSSSVLPVLSSLLEVYPEIAPQVAEALAPWLSSEEENERASAVQALGWIGETNVEMTPVVVEILQYHLNDSTGIVRDSAQSALSTIDAMHILSESVYILPEGSLALAPELPLRMRLMLGGWGLDAAQMATPESVEELLELMGDEDRSLQPRAATLLVSVLEISPTLVSAPAVEGLVQVWLDSQISMPYNTPDVLLEAVAQNPELAAPLMDKLLAVLNTVPSEIYLQSSGSTSAYTARASIVQVLGRLGASQRAVAPQALDGLAVLVMDRNVATRSAAATATRAVVAAYPQAASGELLTALLRILGSDSEMLTGVDYYYWYYDISPWQQEALAALESVVAARPELVTQDIVDLMLKLLAREDQVSGSMIPILRQVAISGTPQSQRMTEILFDELFDQNWGTLNSGTWTILVDATAAAVATYPDFIDETRFESLIAALSEAQDEPYYGYDWYDSTGSKAPMLPKGGWAFVLGTVGSVKPALAPAVWAALEPLSVSESSTTRYWLAQALGKLGAAQPSLSPEILDILHTLLSDEAADMRVQAILAVSQIGTAQASLSPEIVDTLNPLLGDEAENVCIQAILALSRIGIVHPALAEQTLSILSNRLLELPSGKVQESSAIFDALVALGTTHTELVSPALNTLVEQFDHGDASVRYYAVQAFGQMVISTTLATSPAIEALIRWQQSAAPQTRTEVALSLSALIDNEQETSQRITEVLTEWLAGEQSAVRWSLLTGPVSLQTMALREPTETAWMAALLLSWSEDPLPEVRAKVIVDLRILVTRNPRLVTLPVVNTLLDRLDDPDAYVRSRAATTLGACVVTMPEESQRIGVALVPLLKDTTEAVRIAGLVALVQVGKATPAALTPSVFEQVLVLAEAESGNTHYAALALLRLADLSKNPLADRISATLLRHIHGTQYLVRLEAVYVLGQVLAATPDAVPSLLDALYDALEDNDADMHYAALLALETVVLAHPPFVAQSVEVFASQLTDQNPSIQEAAALVLEDILAIYPEAPVPSSLFEHLTNPQHSALRMVARRTLFNIALRDPERYGVIHAEVASLAENSQLITRMTANRTLAMLDVASLTHTLLMDVEDSHKAIATLQAMYGATFFGDDFMWAALEAVSWLQGQRQIKP